MESHLPLISEGSDYFLIALIYMFFQISSTDKSEFHLPFQAIEYDNAGPFWRSMQVYTLNRCADLVYVAVKVRVCLFPGSVLNSTDSNEQFNLVTKIHGKLFMVSQKTLTTCVTIFAIRTKPFVCVIDAEKPKLGR